MPELVRVDVSDAGRLGGAGDDPGEHAQGQGSAVAGQEQPGAVVVVPGLPVGEELDQVRVQRDVAVVVELADGDP